MVTATKIASYDKTKKSAKAEEILFFFPQKTLISFLML